MDYVVLGILFLFVIFLLLREFWCWYWKINARIGLIKKQNDLLENIAISLKQRNGISNNSSGGAQESDLSENASVALPAGFTSLVGISGEAFCLGCRQTAQKTDLLYNQQMDVYYHENCLPQEFQKEDKEIAEGTCPKCGHVNERAENYCIKCSYPLND